MVSALSMLDDIPRDRHEHVTSPTGFQPIQKPRLVTDLATTVENEKATSSIAVMIRAAATSDSDVSGFHRSGPAASSSLGAKLTAGDPLAAALAKALLAKGIITERELEEALEH
jgi:hypothetical protein